jgi:hypothetical protein
MDRRAVDWADEVKQGFEMRKQIIVLGAVLLSACGQSPQDRFLAICNETKAECECVADTLSHAISDDEFDQLLNQMERLDKQEKGDEKIGMLILTGSLVNENVSAALLKSTKICSE